MDRRLQTSVFLQLLHQQKQQKQQKQQRQQGRQRQRQQWRAGRRAQPRRYDDDSDGIGDGSDDIDPAPSALVATTTLSGVDAAADRVVGAAQGGVRVTGRRQRRATTALCD